jgi:hypothetical protein
VGGLAYFFFVKSRFPKHFNDRLWFLNATVLTHAIHLIQEIRVSRVTRLTDFTNVTDVTQKKAGRIVIHLKKKRAR